MEWLAAGDERGYFRQAGEAEARNVQTRMDYTPEQRKAEAPWTTLDVPESELIVRGNSNGPMMSVTKGYRGVSSANKKVDPNITWFSESEDLAKGYSDRGEAF